MMSSICLRCLTRKYYSHLDKMNKLLQHMIGAGDVHHKFLPFIQQFQPGGQKGSSLPVWAREMPRATGDIATLPGVQAPMQSFRRQEVIAQNAEKAKRPVQRPPAQIRQAAPKRSAASKAWAIATNPMTALSYKLPYWSAGRQAPDLPDYFERGERNTLDVATDILNPFGYINAAGNVGSGLARVAARPSTILQEAPGIALNALQAVPAVGEAAMFSNYMRPAIRQAGSTFRRTADLPLTKRLSNAFNSATLKFDKVGDVTYHSYFNMTPDAVRKAVSAETANLPKGAMSVEFSMSKNSAPIYWTQAQRAEGFTPVRTGDMQALNWSGSQGRRLAEAMPKNAAQYVPEFEELTEAVNQRVAYLRQMNTPESIRQAAQLEKEGAMGAFISDLPNLSIDNPGAGKILNEFMENYKPTLDKPIIGMNQKTGLNFPLTNIDRSYSRPVFEQPTIYSIKGSPFRDRFLPAMGDYFKKRANRWYLGDMNFKPTSAPAAPAPERMTLSQIDDYMEDLQQYDFEDGGAIIDPRGQWAHPGKRTIVPTSNGRITMQGVPYPVYGEDETGYGQMMYPGQDYQFPGQMVDERPMMQPGGNVPADIQQGAEEGRQWLKNWYTQRAQLPQFKDVATQRAGLLDKLPPMDYNPGATDKFDAMAYYDSRRSKMVAGNKPVNTSPLVWSHELNHFVKDKAPQPRDLNWGREYADRGIKYKDASKQYGMGAKRFAYMRDPFESEAFLTMFRQQAKLDPTKNYSAEEMRQLMQPYMNAPRMPEQQLQQSGDDFTRDRLRMFFETLGNDPENLLFLHNSTVKNQGRQIPMAKSGGQHGGLDRWFAEKWVDVKTGKACGRQEGENRAYPACRPSRRISSETPKTASEMSPAEKAKFKRSKTSSERINYNHKRN